MSRRPKLLLVGPLPIEGDVIGGTKVSFAALVDAFEASERFELTVQNTSRPRAGRGALRRAFGDLVQLGALLARLAPPRQRYDAVLWNVSAGGALRAAPFVRALCRLRGAQLAVRVFGGDLDLALERAPWPWRPLARRALQNADLLLLQTRALCATFEDDAATSSASWWPTTRDLERSTPLDRPAARRFLFLGQLRREKGVAEALEAARALPSGATLTVHGPPMPGFALEPLLDHASCRYGGTLTPAEIPSVLEAHDALVFPSYHEGEGMPGVIVEALQLGLPVIASDWRSIGELVEDRCNGLLVQPRDASSLAEALTSLTTDEALFASLRAGALATGDRLRGREWNPRLIEWMAALVGDDLGADAALATPAAAPKLEEAA